MKDTKGQQIAERKGKITHTHTQPDYQPETQRKIIQSINHKHKRKIIHTHSISRKRKEKLYIQRVLVRNKQKLYIHTGEYKSKARNGLRTNARNSNTKSMRLFVCAEPPKKPRVLYY